MSYKLIRKSPLTKKYTTMELPLTESEFLDAYHNWKEGTLIQNAFPTLNADQREFIKTGYTSLDWKKMFGGPDAQ